MTANRSSISCGVRTAVGSSRIRTRASLARALTISTRCCCPTERSPTRASGSTSSPKRLESSRISERARGRSRNPRAAYALEAQHHVLGHGKGRNKHEVLVNHADAGSDRVAGILEAGDVPVQQDGALVRPVKAVEDVHERGFPRPVLAEEGVYLSPLGGQIDAVVGDEVAEPLRYSP